MILSVIIGILCLISFITIAFNIGDGFLSIDNKPFAILVAIVTITGVAIFLFIGKKLIKDNGIILLAFVVIILSSILTIPTIGIVQEIRESIKKNYAITHESGNDSKLVFSKVDYEKVGGKVKSFLGKCSDKNGIYLYDDNTNESYLFLNDYHVKMGNKATYFENVKMDIEGELLIIKFDEKSTSDYKNKNIENRLLYKVKKTKNIKSIKVYKNGEETEFDLIGN